ncbi:predicted protein, partial [Arabidopsis lyrata subsp. lyrata]
ESLDMVVVERELSQNLYQYTREIPSCSCIEVTWSKLIKILANLSSTIDLCRLSSVSLSCPSSADIWIKIEWLGFMLFGCRTGFLVRMRANCVRRLALCFLVMAMLSLGGASSEYAYSNGHKNPEEVPDQWAPHVSQKINLAVRGSGHDYKWLSSDTRILVVSFYGVIQAKRPGIATLKAVSTFDSHNFDEVMYTIIVFVVLAM